MEFALGRTINKPNGLKCENIFRDCSRKNKRIFQQLWIYSMVWIYKKYIGFYSICAVFPKPIASQRRFATLYLDDYSCGDAEKLTNNILVVLSAMGIVVNAGDAEKSNIGFWLHPVGTLF